MHGITTEDERSDQFLLPIRLLSILLLLSLIVLAKLILSRTKHKKRQNNHKEEKSYVTKKCDLIKEDSLESRIQDGNEFDSNSNFETHGKNSYKADLHCNPFHHPPPRIYGGIALDKNSGNFFISGGLGKSKLCEDTYCFDRELRDWISLCKIIDPIRSDSKTFSEPSLRYRFQMEVVGNKLISFGGSTNEKEFTNDLLTMKISKENEISSWKQILYQKNSSSFPQPRNSHAMCTYNNKIIIFGGKTSDGSYLNDLWMLETKYLDLATVNESINIWTYLKPSGVYWPKRRSNHSIATIGSKVFLLGGRDEISCKISPPNEIEIFEISTNTWKCEVTCGQEPILSEGFALHAVEKSYKLITVSGSEASHSGLFNRVDVLDITLSPMCWNTIDFEYFGDWTMIPGLRRNFSSIFDPKSKIIFVFGGEKHHSKKNDMEICTSLIIVNMSTFFNDD